MRPFAMSFFLLLISVCLVNVSVAEAGKRGRKGGKALYCQGDHLHYGTSDSFKSKKQAFKDAVVSWAGFTVFEYGSEWGNWRLSVNKKVSCKNSGGAWQCSIQSTPCRRAKRGERGKFR